MLLVRLARLQIGDQFPQRGLAPRRRSLPFEPLVESRGLFQERLRGSFVQPLCGAVIAIPVNDHEVRIYLPLGNSISKPGRTRKVVSDAGKTVVWGCTPILALSSLPSGQITIAGPLGIWYTPA